MASAATGAKLEDLFEQIQRGEMATLNIVLKADVQGSLEAVTESLKRLEREDVKLSFVLRGIGGITENDVQLAAASSATIIGFNVRPDRRSRELAEASDVEIRTYEIIYKLLEDIEAAMLGLLSPLYEEVVTGEAEVREVFRVPVSGPSPVATCGRARSPAARRSGSSARGRSSGRAPSRRCVDSRTTRERWRPASSAVSGCRTSRISTTATSSKRLRSARSRGRDVIVKRRTATYPRSLRVNQVLRQVIAEELERLADADERLRMVTVTSVDTAADMRTATVYLATLESDAAEALEERRPHLQRLIGAQVTLKRTPAADVQGRSGHRRRVAGRRAAARPGQGSRRTDS